jgi:hypothetical protein
MIVRSQRNKAIPLNIVGSSVFGRYPKIDSEKTYNMFESDEFMVPYAGYQVAVPASMFGNGIQGRGVHTSTKLGLMIVVIDDRVYSVNIFFDQNTLMTQDITVIQLGVLETSTGVVYIAENNKPQIAISDGKQIYIYDPNPPAGVGVFQVATQNGLPTGKALSFTPGFIDFHDTYFIVAASKDEFYEPPADNTWRLSTLITIAGAPYVSFPDTAQNIGLIQTKPDNTQATVRFPSRGNMIFVMGKTVTESWFDTGAQLFPYQRNDQYNIDYGCINPATVASMDTIVAWLAQNEKSGPIIVYSTGGLPEKITTDGIDYLFSQLQNPADSQAFMYRQDGHLFYHINFYTDNLSLFYDFNTKKFYHASDQHLNYFIAGEVAFFNNQYYFTTKNDGNLYAFDTIYTTYSNSMDATGLPIKHEQPRIRICANIRDVTQEYFIANDVGFTIESGETDYFQQNLGPIYLITQDYKYIITQGEFFFLETQDGFIIETQNGNELISQQVNPADFSFLISQQNDIAYVTPRVDLSISIDGGANFGNEWAYDLPPIGIRKNRLMWWQLGAANDLVCQFKFWGIGRFVATNGVVNIRQ